MLNVKADYAVLRNYELLPYDNNSRDIDIIIDKKSYKNIKNDFLDIIVDYNWKVLTYLNSDRLVSYVCAIDNSCNIEIVQWDFFFDTSVWGIQLMSADDFLNHRQFNGFLYHVNIDCNFLDKYLYNRAVGEKYPDKYNDIKILSSKSLFVTNKINKLFRCENVEICDNKSKFYLILNALIYNIRRRPVALLFDVFCFLFFFVKNYICSNTGFSIAFTGPDGSGKSTIIELLLKQMSPVFDKAHVYFHFRPTLFKNLGEVACSAGIKKDVDRNYDKPHRAEKTGKINSLLRLYYYSLDYIIGYFLKVKVNVRITRVVVFDRYFTDIVCDSKRSRIYLKYKFLYLWYKALIPKLDYNILLTANPKIILERKKELDYNSVVSINNIIDFLSLKNNYKKIVNELKPEDSVREIFSYVLNMQHEKNIKRLR